MHNFPNRETGFKMSTSQAWNDFLGPETMGTQDLLSQLTRARENQHRLLKLVPGLPNLAKSWSQGQKREAATEIIGYLENPSLAGFFWKPLISLVAEQLPITPEQWATLKDWVNDQEDHGIKFLGNFLAYLIGDNETPSGALIDLFGQFREKMRAA
jgi:hypothetical protein